MWLVRYSEAGKTTGSYVCLVRFVPDGGQDDSGTDAERLAQAQKTLAALSTITPATQPATKPATSQGTLHSRELSGTWAGEQDGIKATIKFYGHDHNGDAIWRVEVPNGTISARLKPVDDQETGTVALRLDYTTTATGKSGSAVIGRLERNAAGGLILAILPAASQFNSDYPAMRIILQRVATAESSSVTQPAPK